MSTVSFAPTVEKENTILTEECVTFLANPLSLSYQY